MATAGWATVVVTTDGAGGDRCGNGPVGTRSNHTQPRLEPTASLQPFGAILG